jgi:hypothetical protein
MEGPVSVEPVASSDPASFADPAHLLELFLQVISAESLKDFDLGHAGLFNSWLVTWLMVWQRSQGNASMAEAVAETLLGTTFNYLPECKRVLDRNISPNTSAYSQGRSRLPLEAAVHVADTAFATLTAGLPPAWKGRPAYLIDGSSLTLTHQAELVEQFPPAVNQYGASHWPVVLFVVAHELCTGFSPRWESGAMYGPEAIGETALGKRLLPRLPAEAVIVYDRNFGIFMMSYEAVQAGHDVVARMTEKRFRAVTKKMQQTAPGEWKGMWRPSDWDRKKNPQLPADAEVYGRFVEIHLIHGEKKVVLLLFTTEMTATHEELAELYRKRWDIESDIRDVKQTLNMHALSGRSVDIVEKEMVLGAVAYNLVLAVRRLAAVQAKVPPRELSFSRTLALTKAFAQSVGVGTLEQQKDRFERLLKAVARCRLPRRAGRSYRRELIPRRRGFAERKRAQELNKKS